MKYTTILGLSCIVSIAALGQHGKGMLLASVSGTERITLIKNSIDVPVWHERIFWSLYERFLNDASDVYTSARQTLTDFATLDGTLQDADVLAYANKMIQYRKDLLKLYEEYFSQISKGFNGVIALQFLQSEMLLDMIECSQVYESSEWNNYRFSSHLINESTVKQAKHNTIGKALDIPAEKADAFWKVYSQYENSCDALLGEDYDMISLYAVNPEDFTPALAKRLGYELLQVMQRELKLKEKYLQLMTDAVGASLAVRLLAWEDFYSLTSKMYAFAAH